MALLTGGYVGYVATHPHATDTAAQGQHSTSTPTPSGSPSVAAGPAWYDVPGLDTVQRLARFAEQLRDAETDALTGRYRCRRTQSWSRATTALHRDDTTTCRDDTDGSGLEFERVLPDRPGLLPLPDGSDRPQFATAQPYIQHYSSGHLQPLVPEPVPTDPVQLTDAVLMHRRQGPPKLARGDSSDSS
ncbi:hypothetical protein [Dactylosporangium cerinum]